MSGEYSRVRKLTASDRVDGFDCGQPALNQFLQRFALVNQKANSAQTYVCCQGDAVVGSGEFFVQFVFVQSVGFADLPLQAVALHSGLERALGYRKRDLRRKLRLCFLSQLHPHHPQRVSHV